MNIPLTSNLEYPKSFHKCQLCGYENSDICSFNLWQECNSKDKPTNRYLIVGKHCGCQEKYIVPHSLMYILVSWSAGGPGRFTLLCGDCPSRNNFSCMHPNLKSNGGKGLNVILSNPLGIVHINVSGKKRFKDILPAVNCEGNPQHA